MKTNISVEDILFTDDDDNAYDADYDSDYDSDFDENRINKIKL